MNKIDSPEADQRFAALMARTDAMVELTRKLYASTEDMSPVRRYLQVMQTMQAAREETEAVQGPSAHELWLPLAAALLLRIADPTVEILKEKEWGE